MRRTNVAVRLLFLFTLTLLLLISSDPAIAQERLTLKDCLSLAMGKNVQIVSSRHSLQAAKYNLLDAWGDALPSASVSGSYNFSKDLKPEFRQDLGREYQDPGTKSYRTGINLSMTLFDGGRTWYQIKSESLAKESEKNRLTDTEQSIVYTVKQRYYALVSAIMAKRVQDDALASSKKQLEITSSRYELGSASLSEKLKQQVRVASDSVLLLQRENSIHTAAFSLNLVMNRDVSLTIVPADTLGLIEFSLGLEQCIDMALKNNPSLKKTKADYDRSRTGVAMARGAWLPTVTAGMSWGWGTSRFTAFGFDIDTVAMDTLITEREATTTGRSYSFGISASYNIFDSFRKKTDYSRARLTERTAREVFDESKNGLVEEVRRNHLDIRRAKLQYEASLLGETSANEDLKLQQERYRLGASSILELLDAQRSLTEARYAKITALYELNLAVAAMTRALGQI